MRGRESLIDKHLGVCRMIDDEQRDVIEEMCLPQFRGDTHVVGAVARHKLLTSDPHPVFRLPYTGGVLCVDAQPKRRSPEEVGHKPHTAAVPCKHPGARSFQPLLRHDRIVHAAAEFGLRDPIRPDDARDVDGGVGAETEVKRRAGEHLRLHEQSRSHLDVAADAERVDTLIAGILLCARTNHFPVIARRPFAEPSGWPSSGNADKIQHAVPVEVGSRKDIACRRRGQGLQLMTAISQPDPRLAASRCREIERTVVVEIGGDQTMAAWRRASQTVPSCDLAGGPHLALPGCDPNDTHGVQCGDIDHAIGIDIGDGRSGNVGWAAQIGCTSERAGLPVDVDMQRAGRIDEDSVRVCITIEIGPCERTRVERAGEWLLHLPRAIAVVPQHDRGAFPYADNQIEIAVHLDVGRPGTRAVVGRKRARVGTSGHVDKRAVLVLKEQEHTTGPAQGNVGPEVVIPIERHDRVAHRRRIRGGCPHRQRPCTGRTVDTLNATGIGGNQRQGAVSVHRERQRNGDRPARCSAERLRRKCQLHIRDGWCRRWRREDEKAIEWLGDELGRRAYGD